tara:strand:- start:1497 stop:1898 length:402 start_codon:yes stop_codon:yes gene_type:complete
VINQRGFTLIEILLTLVVVGVLALIAIPSYQHYVIQQNTRSVQSEMQLGVLDLEKHYMKHHSYIGADSQIKINNAEYSETYKFKLLNLSKTTFTFEAVGTKKAIKCFKMTINEIGQHRAFSADGKDVTRACWK